MRTRTHLTTPPGQHPAPSATARSGDEHYVPGLALPAEPRVPGRHRRTLVGLAVAATVMVVAVTAFLVMTAGQSFDPALDTDPTSEASDDPTSGQTAG